MIRKARVAQHVMPREQIIRLAMDCFDRHYREHLFSGSTRHSVE